MIEIERLRRCYGDVVAVDDVGFAVERGEVIGLLGHNGAGKTTIMKMMTGFLTPDSGVIRVGDLQVGRDTRAIQKRIGYLPENCPLWPEMTVADYLEFQAAMHGVAPAQRREAVIRAIRMTALKEKTAAPIQTLSRGYRQRVGVAQALLHRPDIFILDEPTNGLDPTQIRHMRSLIEELAQDATVIVSTHILQEVQAVCERVLILRRGRLAVDARMEDLAQSDVLMVQVGGDALRVLQQTPGVNKVREIERDGSLRRYRLDAPADAAPLAAESLANAGLALYGLQPLRRDLETVFAEVNEEEVGHV